MSAAAEIDWKSPPFDQYSTIRAMSPDRGGPSSEHARHRLYIARDRRTRTQVLIKVTAKPGLVYERNLENEIESLIRINRELPEYPQFPVVHDHGRMPDGRLYLIASLFDELPLAASVPAEPMPDRLVGHLRTLLEVSHAVMALHRLPIFHVDLNPMNILSRTERGRPWIRIVDFESSYDVARHSAGVFYDPPTTPGFSAPEIGRQPPDARADVFSLGAVLYTLIAGYGWTWETDIATHIGRDAVIDADLKTILLEAVALEPDRRTPTMEAFSSAVAKYLEQIWPGRS